MTIEPPCPPGPKLWATYIPSRRPQKKLHGNVGHAKNAILNAIQNISYNRAAMHDMIIWQMIDGAWIEYAIIPKGMMIDELPWRKN